jgi:hypothetical protein
VRRVELLPILRDELSALKALRKPADDEPVFRSAAGTRQDRNRVRGRTLARSIKRANELLAKDGLSALPERLTPHSLRRTFASLLIALGKDPAYVMRQMGHTSPTMTLGLYAQVMDASDEDRERLRTLVEGAELPALSSSAPRANERQRPVGDQPQHHEANDDRSARVREEGGGDNDGGGDRERDDHAHDKASPLGPVHLAPRLAQRSPVPPPNPSHSRQPSAAEGSELALIGTSGDSDDPENVENPDGRGGFRTCDLSRVKRALSH